MMAAIEDVHTILIQSLEQEVRDSQIMEDKLVGLLEETCIRVEKSVLESGI